MSKQGGLLSYGMEESFMLSPELRFVSVEENTGFVIGNHDILQITGGIYVTILQLMDADSFSPLQLAEKLSDKFYPPHILHALSVLSDKSYIIRKSLFNSENFLSREQAQSILSTEITGLVKYKITLLKSLESTDAEKAFNEALYEKKIWIPVLIGEGKTFAGPVFNKQIAGPCLECLKRAIKQNSSVLSWIKRDSIDCKSLHAEYIPATLVYSLKKILTRLSGKWITSGVLRDKLITTNREGILKLHYLKRRPECSNCGNKELSERQMSRPVYLSDSEKSFNNTFDYRTISAAETWKKIKSHVSPVSGIASEIRKLGSDDKTMHVYAAVYPDIPEIEIPKAHEFHRAAFGKGKSAVDSKVSALAEAIERRSARYRGDEPMFTASLEDLGPRAVAPLRIQHFLKRQLENPEKTPGLGAVPQQLLETEGCDWVPAWSLRNQERRYIPADAVLYGIPKHEKKRIAVFESNGLSAGNTPEEAILQGILELIERDAVAIWWFNRLLRPAYPVDSIKEDAWFQAAMSQLQSEGWSVSFIDLTIDTGIPVVAAIGSFNQGYLAGYGCHFNPQYALSRALTELIQVKTLMNPVKPPGNEDVAYLYPSEIGKYLKIEPLQLPPSYSAGEVCRFLVRQLASLGIDTIVVDCSRPDSGLSVAKVFAPGLRAFRPRFAPGRLFDVPVSSGLLKKPKSPEEMNTFWMTYQSSLPIDKP